MPSQVINYWRYNSCNLPVIITVLMLAFFRILMTGVVSGLRVFSMAISPPKIRSCSTSSLKGQFSVSYSNAQPHVHLTPHLVTSAGVNNIHTSLITSSHFTHYMYIITLHSLHHHTSLITSSHFTHYILTLDTSLITSSHSTHYILTLDTSLITSSSPLITSSQVTHYIITFQSLHHHISLITSSRSHNSFRSYM